MAENGNPVERKEFVTVSFTIPYGGERRTEAEARAIVEKLRATGRRLHIELPFVEDDWEV